MNAYGFNMLNNRGVHRCAGRAGADQFNLNGADDDLILDELEPKIYYKYVDKESGPPYYTKVDEYYLVTPEQYHRCIEQKPVETVQDVSFEEVKDSGPTNADILEAIGGLAKTLDKLM